MIQVIEAWLGAMRHRYDRSPSVAPPPVLASRTLFAAVTLGATFGLGILIGLQLHFPASLVYFVWPPSVILFVALLLTPRRMWWVYLVVLFPIHMLLEWRIVAAPPLSLALFYAVVWVQALVGALVVEWLAALPFEFINLWSLIAFLLGAGAAALAEAASLTFVLGATAPGTNLSLTFGQTFLADSLTMVTFGPLLVLVGSKALRAWYTAKAEARASGGHFNSRRVIVLWSGRIERDRLLEACLLAVGMLAVGLAAFGGFLTVPGTFPALLYALLPLLLWAAMRFGLGGTSLATFGLTMLSILFAIHLRGPFSDESFAAGLLSLQLVFIAVTVPMLVLAVIVEERQHTQTDLRLSEARYRAVVSNFPFGAVLLFGPDLRHLFADGQGLPRVGLTKASIEGRTLWEAFPAGMAATLEGHYRAALSGSPSEFDLIHQGRTYQTQVVPIQNSMTPTGMVVLQDVTEERRAKLLAEVDRAKTAFFSNVSHEFRTPLTLLLAPAADALADREAPLPESQRERLQLIQRNGQRLQKLVNSLLDFARIEADTIQAKCTLTDLAIFTSDVASTFRSAIEREGVALVVECEPRPHLAYVDRDMWEKIVLNLLSNALKFTFQGQITVRLRTIADAIELRVEDTGTGIAAEDLPHIFERFYRAQHGGARTQEGTGIGLTLVHELARLHGGTARAESTLGRGSAFTVRVPRDTAQVPSEIVESASLEASADATSHPSSSGTYRGAQTVAPAETVPDDALPRVEEIEEIEEIAHAPAGASLSATPEAATAADGSPSVASLFADACILVADDNADMRDYLVRILGAHWQVDAASSGAAALARARERPPDLVLADVMMPDLDGFALLRALRADPVTSICPVVLLSARAGEEAIIEGLDAGADDYFVKPFASRELVARVRTHLELAYLRRQAMQHGRQLEAIFQAMTEGVYVFDAQGEMTEANRAALALLDLLRDSQFVQYATEDGAPLLTAVEERSDALALPRLTLPRLLRGEAFSEERALNLRVQARDGQMRTIQVTGSPVRDEIGQITAAVAVCRDITERKQAEADLRRAKAAAETARGEAEVAKKQEEQRRLAAETLRDVMGILNSEHTLDDVLDFIVRQAAALLGSQAAIIYRVPPTPDGLVVLSAFNVTRGSLPPAIAAYQPLSAAAMNYMLLGDGATDIYDTSRLAELFPPSRKPEKLPPAQFVIPLEPSSAAVLAGPIFVGGELYGGLALLYQQPRPFTSNERSLTSMLCDQVAIAIENANLRAQATRASVLAERARIAREFHDAVTQTLFSASLVASALPDVWEKDRSAGRQGLDNLRLLTRTALAEMRTLLVELRPAALTEKPLGDLLRQLAEAMSTRAQAEIAVEVKPDTGDPLPPNVQIAYYRIAQEALNNAAKYAHARHVRIQMRTSGDRVTLRIRDDGDGFVAARATAPSLRAGRYDGDGDRQARHALLVADRPGSPEGSGSGRSGIAIMHERARSVGASLALRSRPGWGTLIVVRWPGNGDMVEGGEEAGEDAESKALTP